jgi:hypothetical protein
VPAAWTDGAAGARWFAAFHRPGRGRLTGTRTESNSMDMLYLGITVLFFALSWGLVKLCERL